MSTDLGTFSWPTSESGSNPSVGSNGSTAPSSSTEIGIIDGSGKLQGVSSSNPLPVTASSLPLPAGAATAALQTTGNAELVTINTTLGSPFQAGGSIGNTSFASTQSGAWNVGITGTVPLPTGAATSALQTTGNTALTTINTTLGTPMQQTGGSVTANLGTLNGAATAALQTTGNTALTTINTTLGTPMQNSGGSVSISSLPALVSAFYSGQKTSTGTAVALSTSQAISNGVIVQALSTNAGLVYIGPSGVTTSTGFQLQPGQATSVAVNNLSTVFVIAATSGDGVCYVGS